MLKTNTGNASGKAGESSDESGKISDISLNGKPLDAIAKATGVAGASSKPLTADVNIVLPETRAERLEGQAINGKEKLRRARRQGEREEKGEGEGER